MTMGQDMLRRMQADDLRLRQTETKETPQYTTGTFVAGFGGSGGGGNYTQTYAIGEYTRIGNACTVWMRLLMNTFVAPPAGNLWVVTLPFTARNTANQFYAVTIGYRNTALNAMTMALIQPGTTRIEFYDTTGANIPAASLSAASNLVLAATYPL